MVEPYLSQDMLDRLVRLDRVKRKAALVKIGQEEFARCAEDIFYWLDKSRHPIPYVYTKDPKPMHACGICQDGEAYNFDKRRVHLLSRHGIEAHTDAEMRKVFNELPTIRPFPMLPYIRPIVETLLQEKMIAIEKSRDMLGTWTVVMFLTWDTLFHAGRQTIFQSENSTKTRDLVDRAYTIYINQPVWLRAQHKAIQSEGSNRSGLIKAPSLQSEIIGFPQGADKLRAYHPSNIFSDEAAFNPNAGESFAAIKPAVGMGGRYIAISSANVSWFMHACRDTLT